ncbi:hypothetical protein ASPVEDRAFT_894501 [Aspergillus versicolor CBS 583.65]|uniref:Uncharacterized protein n=1 Tax=Aspergillus versicolor CBS 583.65 TaxID=1036611 RepID=A0A1L9PVU8_ASPVE|nr:uncharacterized protein ASPVEDRAFT_894501 [Aspergillus versicolor CBS 583.65]OJJ05593.1 hypothetical protein ASPVEDRAFT_894501 [Aspergillus versicolor CBS 583.65]
MSSGRRRSGEDGSDDGRNDNAMNPHAKRSKSSFNADGPAESDLGGSNQVRPPNQNEQHSMLVQQPVAPFPLEHTSSADVADNTVPRPRPPVSHSAYTGNTAYTEDVTELIKAGFVSLERRLDMLSSQVDMLTSRVDMLTGRNTAPTTNPSSSMPVSSESGKLGGQPAQLPNINNDKTKIVSCGIPGVPYDISDVQVLGYTPTNIGGALGLSNTSEVWALFLHDSSTKPLLEQYINARKMVSSAQYNVIHLKVMNDLWTDLKLRQLMRGDDPPTIASIGVKVGTYCSILTGWYASQVMKSKPGLFPHSSLLISDDEDGDDNIHINPCDWLHAWKLLALFWKFRDIMGKPRHPYPDIPIEAVFHSNRDTLDAPHGVERQRRIWRWRKPKTRTRLTPISSFSDHELEGVQLVYQLPSRQADGQESLLDIFTPFYASSPGYQMVSKDHSFPLATQSSTSISPPAVLPINGSIW